MLLVWSAHCKDVEADGCGKVAQAQHLLQEELGYQVHRHAVCKECDPRLHSCKALASCVSLLIRIRESSEVASHSSNYDLRLQARARLQVVTDDARNVNNSPGRGACGLSTGST